MKKAFWAWLSWFMFLFVAAFVVPFRFLSDVKRVTGGFLFWIVWILIAILSMFLIVSTWKDPDRVHRA